MRAVAAILVACFLAVAAPATGAAEDAVAQFRAFFAEVESMRGSFVQEARDQSGELLERSSGTMAVQRPDRFRWVYEQPYRQVIVADGTDLWVYDVALEQVSVRPMDEMLAAGPALLLSGSLQELERDFHIGAGDSPGWVRLEARDSQWQFDAVRIRMEDGLPRRLELEDSLGQTTMLDLDDVRVNPQLAPALFRFDPPEGVDVIGREDVAAQ